MQAVLSSFARFIAITLVVAAADARAADTWTTPFPGARYLHRSTSEPKEIHALLVDLRTPGLSVRATRESEKGRTPTSFSTLVGAKAVINGDFYNTNGSFHPVGLAVGTGSTWANTADSPGHSFVACTANNRCEIDLSGSSRAVSSGWESVVGGNVILVNHGSRHTSANDTSCGDFCTVAHPRTAVGITQDGNTLILVMVEGRRSPVYGLSLSRLATLMAELGAYDALNLDGGGSSGIVINGQLANQRPSNEPSERRVSNHLAILYGQPPSTGRLVGFIRREDIYNADAGLAGATVTLSTGQSATTDSRGFYDFPAVTPGPVTVTASLAGYQNASGDKDVVAGTTNWKSMALYPAVPEPVDAGSPPDAGAPPDAGSPPDAAIAEPDAGSLPDDAGEPQADSGLEVDAAVVEDAGAEFDAGTEAQVDASVSVAQPDAGAAAAESEDDGSSQDNTRPGMGCSSTELPGGHGIPASLALFAAALVARRRRAR